MTAISVPTAHYAQPLDIANKACFHWGVAKIADFGVANGGTDDSVQAQVAADLYEGSRRTEMRRNVWTFSCKTAFLRPINTPLGPANLGGTLMNNSGLTGLLVPAAWDITKTYLPGSIVSYGGEIYQAAAPVTIALEPDQNPSSWTQFFGTLAVNQWVNGGNVNNPPLWSSSVTYASGTTVEGSDGNIYNSLVNGLLNVNPTTDGGVHWQLIGAAQTGSGYFAGELVYLQNAGVMSVYVSLTTGNNDQPGNVPSYSATLQYVIGQTVTGSDANVYQSKVDFNIGFNPVGDAGVHWIAVPATQTDQMTGDSWLLLGEATVKALNVLYPAGSGPLDQVATRNVYLLPNGFLREAPQDPKAGSTSYLGAPSGLAYDDWVFDGPYLISREVEPICLRFAADVQQVTAMDPMFCELLALRIALDGNERVTQAAEKEGAIGQKYKQFGADARTVNGIEQGPTEPPEDDYITCRL